MAVATHLHEAAFRKLKQLAETHSARLRHGTTAMYILLFLLSLVSTPFVSNFHGHRCLVAGFFANVAKLSPDGRYRTVRDSTVIAIHPSSVLAHFGSPPEWILFHEISKTTQLFARDVSVIDPR